MCTLSTYAVSAGVGDRVPSQTSGFCCYIEAPNVCRASLLTHSTSSRVDIASVLRVDTNIAELPRFDIFRLVTKYPRSLLLFNIVHHPVDNPAAFKN